MTESILQNFADAKFLNLILKNPEDLEALEKSAADLAKKLKHKGKRTLLPSYVLLAINPNIKDTEPLLDEVEAIAKSKNKLLLSRSNDRPVTALRAIILSALEILVDSEQKFHEDYAKIIYLTAKESFGYIDFASAEEGKIIEAFIRLLGEKGELFSRRKWKVNMVSFLNEIVTKFELKLTETFPSTNNSFLTSKKIANVKLEQTDSYNRRSVSRIEGINADSFNTWSKEFVKKASSAITGEINNQLKAQNKSINEFSSEISKELNKFTTSLNTFVSNSINNSLSGINALVERDQLNWWKESLYSASKWCSYRAIENPVALAFLMSHDCGALTHPHSPESVDYFLMETFRKVENKEESLSFQEILTALSTADCEWLGEIIPATSETTSIISLPDFLVGFVHGLYTQEDFEKLTYISLAEKIKPAAFCVWLFHYFQSKRLTHGN